LKQEESSPLKVRDRARASGNVIGREKEEGNEKKEKIETQGKTNMLSTREKNLQSI